MTLRVLPILVAILLLHAWIEPVMMTDESAPRPFPPESGPLDAEGIEVVRTGESVYGPLVYALPLMLVTVGSGFVLACWILLTLLIFLLALPLHAFCRLSTPFRLRFLR